MRQEQLRVIHLRKGPSTDLRLGACVSELLPNAFFLDSCQRWLWVCSRADLARAEQDGALAQYPGIALHEGVDAYAFLLRVATGLESQVVGETDIFGQLKEAWRRHPSSPELDALMQRLFEDTKDIRSRYLQNLGGASYGSLVRMLLRGSQGPTLVVGAGQIAQSVAPYLMSGEGSELWLSNRNPENLATLYADLISRRQVQTLGHAASGEIRIIGASAREEREAWRNAANVVVCVPFDALKDAERVALREARAAAGETGRVVHLAGLREQAGAWNRLAEFHSLDDLFTLQKSQGDARTGLIVKAIRACDEKAKLRSLGASITIPHGWEDLAIFV